MILATPFKHDFTVKDTITILLFLDLFKLWKYTHVKNVGSIRVANVTIFHNKHYAMPIARY